MRRSSILFAVLALGITAGPALAEDAAAPTFKDQREKTSYITGIIVGNMIKNQYSDLDTKLVMRGVEDGLNGVKHNFTPEEIQQTVQGYEAEQAKKMQAMAETNIQEGQEFLDKNKKNPDVVTLPSGLQYKILKQGDGPSPAPTDKVTVRYKGTFLNGKVFDSTDDGREPVTFRVDQVIPAWQEALPLMKVGSKWELYVPSKLAYGPPGNPPIGPNATLIFQIELLGINQNQ
jgi:FKBP-type peptidyl-prolyl cis-trans isomerase FklB